MASFNLTPKKALGLFVAITAVLIGQAVWWIVFMARLVDEKVQMAIDLGADQGFVDLVHEQEIRRQIMVGSEGVFFIILAGLGAWLIYRALVKAEELKFHQQNFIMAVTHELKTPLASIKIYLDSLESPKISDDKKIAILPHLRQDTDRLEKLVEDVLEAGRFERSGYQLSRERFDFSRLVDDLLGNMADHPIELPLRINKQTFQRNIQIRGDRTALRRALVAVLDNAIKYNDKDAAELDIELRRESQSVCLRISDNGVGLTKAELGQIFNRFYRVGGGLNHSKPGSGLGLYLCSEIVRAHGGRITAQSEGPGKGTSILIKLKAETTDEINSAG